MTHTLASPELLSVATAARFLKEERGIGTATRHQVYRALAAGQLRLAGTSGAVMLIERSELERFATVISRVVSPDA
jgi:hypothetical protein